MRGEGLADITGRRHENSAEQQASQEALRQDLFKQMQEAKVRKAEEVRKEKELDEKVRVPRPPLPAPARLLHHPLPAAHPRFPPRSMSSGSISRTASRRPLLPAAENRRSSRAQAPPPPTVPPPTTPRARAR